MNTKDYYQIPLPKLFDRDRQFVQTISPISVSLDMNIVPLSTATIVMPSDDDAVQPRYYVELFTALGSMGMFRTRQPSFSYSDNTSEIEVESAITELGDYFVTQKYEQMMEPMTAISTIFQYYTWAGGTFWQLNTMENPFGEARQVALSCDHESILDILMNIMAQLPAYMITMDYTTNPWTLGFAKRPTTITAECRAGRNVESMTISYDDSEMCTRLWYEWQDSWHMIQDLDFIEGWGVIEKSISVSNDGYAEEITAQVYDYLYKHSHPKISIEVQAEDLSRLTNQQLDTFELGKRCRIVIPLNGSETYAVLNIKEMSWDDVYGDPLSIRLLLEEEEDAVWEFIHPEVNEASE